MKLLYCILLFAVGAMAQKGKPYYDVNNAPILFEKFVKNYNRNYKDEADKDTHYRAFVKTLRFINQANEESSSATFDINNLSDYTPEGQRTGAMAQEDKPYYDVNNAPILFEKFVKDYNRNYKDEADKDVHYRAFVKTLRFINQANEVSSSATFDINNLSDYTPEGQRTGAMAQEDKPYYDVNNAPILFEKFVKDYNRNYKDEADKDVHYRAFVKTLRFINQANEVSSSATFDINNLSDYTPEGQRTEDTK